jgi:hypothetical protein
MSFHYFGRDKRGVGIWKGGYNNLPRWLTYPFMGYGFLAGLLGAGGLIMRWLRGPSEGLTTFCTVFIIHFFVFGLVGVWMEWMRRKIDALTPEKQALQHLNMSQEELKRLAAERGIKPVYNINDQDYYNLADLTDAMSLLRASAAPATAAQELLRPAGHTASQPETLLRAAPAATVPAPNQDNAAAETQTVNAQQR